METIQEIIDMIKELSGRDILFLSFYCGFILILSIHRSDEKASVDEEAKVPDNGPEPEK